MASILLLESGDALLVEGGGYIFLDTGRMYGPRSVVSTPFRFATLVAVKRSS